jgi:hypothetical protein
VKPASPEEQEPERPSATGAGTGNDTARLSHEGYEVTAIDLSTEAIEQAQAKFGATVTFLVADMALSLPFPHASFDAVMSNVALHMFSDSVTPDRSSTRSGDWCGPEACFSFTSTRSKTVALRASWRPVVRELEEDYVLELEGQTMHFFSEAYLRELLREWLVSGSSRRPVLSSMRTRPAESTDP